MTVMITPTNAGAPNILQSLGIKLIPVVNQNRPVTFTMGDGLDADCPSRTVTLTNSSDMMDRPLIRNDVRKLLGREPLARHVMLARDITTGREHVMGVKRQDAEEFENWTPYALNAEWGTKGLAGTRIHDVTKLYEMYCGAQTLANPDHLVTHFSYYDALYIAALFSNALGREARLPTEAEMEYALQEAIFQRAVAQNADGPGSINNYTADDRGFKALLASVWQWCLDNYGPYPDGVLNNPTGPTSGDARVLRGGAWYNNDLYCRAAYRYCDHPDYRYNDFGARLVVPRT